MPLPKVLLVWYKESEVTNQPFIMLWRYVYISKDEDPLNKLN